MYKGVSPQNHNYLLEGGPPYSTGFCHYVIILGAHLYQCTSWHHCERLHLAFMNSLEDSFNAFFHFMMGDLQAHLPTLQ